MNLQLSYVESSKVMTKKLTQEEATGAFEKLSKELEELNKDYKIVRYDYFENVLKSVAGSILTIIDASIADGRQNKCVKDLIKSAISEKIYRLQKYYYKENKSHMVRLEEEKIN